MTYPVRSHSGSINDNVTEFGDDADISTWAKQYVSAAVECKMISGMDNNKFMPKSFATRAQAVTM